MAKEISEGFIAIPKELFAELQTAKHQLIIINQSGIKYKYLKKDEINLASDFDDVDIWR
jgi:hypothetical protein